MDLVGLVCLEFGVWSLDLVVAVVVVVVDGGGRKERLVVVRRSVADSLD